MPSSGIVLVVSNIVLKSFAIPSQTYKSLPRVLISERFKKPSFMLSRPYVIEHAIQVKRKRARSILSSVFKWHDPEQVQRALPSAYF